MSKCQEKRNKILYARVSAYTKSCVKKAVKILKADSEAEAADKLIRIGFLKVQKEHDCK